MVTYMLGDVFVCYASAQRVINRIVITGILILVPITNSTQDILLPMHQLRNKFYSNII